MSEKPQSPAPGYYPDESGVSRYWDGTKWTDQTQQAPTGGAPTMTRSGNAKADAKAAKAYTKAERPWFKKKRWIAAIILLIIIVIAVATSGGTSEEGPEKLNSDGSSSSSKGDSDEDKVGSNSNPLKVGETVKLEGTQYTVESVETSTEVGDEFFMETAGGVYVIVELTIENKKDETKTFFGDAAKFIASNDKKYSTDDDGSFAAEDPLILEDMQPDVPKTGLLVFDVPKELTKGGVLEVGDLFGGGEAYIDLGLK